MRNGQQHMGAADLPRPKEIVFHVTCALIVAHGLSPCMAWAQAIVPDGRTLTTVTPDAGAAVVNIHTGTVLGNGNALNSFSRFNVGEGQVANLHVPDTAAALINLVRDQTTTIGGMLNAIKDGKIGGKVYFANPHGFIVSNTGVVNVGSLHVSTPSQQFVDEFFSATGGAEASSAQLVAGTAPRNRDAQVRIDGTVNAIEQVAVNAGSVVVGGKVFTGARFSGTDPDFKDVVNVHGLDAASTVAVHDGRILIVGDDDISVTGTLSTRRVADGSDATLRSGASVGASSDISLEARSVTLGSGARVLAAGGAGHAGGDVNVQAAASGGLLDVVSDTRARVGIQGATVTGRDITATAKAEHDSSLSPVVTKTVAAEAELNDATLEASGMLAVRAEAVATVATPDFVPLAVVDVDVSANVKVAGNSRLSGTAGTELSARVDAELSARPGLPDFGELPGDAGVAVVTSNTTATVDVLGDSEVGSTLGRSDLSATNNTRVDAAVDASASGDTAVGGAVAVTVVRSTTRARAADNARLSGKTGVGVRAASTTLVATSAKAAAGGATERGAEESKTEETLETYKDDAATADGGVTVAAAVAVSDLESHTLAAVDASRPLQSDGALTVAGTALTQAEVEADGSSAGGSVGVGVGVALNLARVSNEARVAQQVEAAGIEASARTPAGDDTNLFTSTATSGAGASDVGVAGALAINVIDNLTNATISAAGDVDAKNGNVAIDAENRSTSNASATPAEDATASGDTVGVGASVAVNVVSNEGRAQLADGARLRNAAALDVKAEGDYSARTEAEAGAEGGIAATPVAAVTVADNKTLAGIGSGEAVHTSGAVSVEARHASTTETVAKGSATGEKAAIGIGVAVNVVAETVSASVGRDLHAGSTIRVAAESRHSSSADATASAKGGKEEKKDGGDDDTPEDGVDQEIGRQAGFAQDKQKDGSDSKTQAPDSAETSEGKISVAAAVAVNSARVSTSATIADGVDVSAAGALEVEASGNTDASASADGSAAGSTTTVGIGAAVAINSVTSHTAAWIGNAQVRAEGIAVRALMTAVDSDTVNSFSSSAKAGAGAGKVGIAGALALNLIDTRSTAEIHGGAELDADGHDIELRAESASETSATALPDEPASGGKLGVGASVALNLFREDLVRARVRNGAQLIDLDKLQVVADARSDSKAEAEAGAEGSVALDAVVALSDLKLKTEAIVEAGAQITATGPVEIRASSAGEHEASATGDVKSDKVGVGASGAIILSTTHTLASLARDLVTTTSGDDGKVDITATSTRSYEAIAKASAAGGKAEDETTATERDKAATTSTLKDNESAQQGTETTGSGSKVAIAAAAGVLVLDDDARATVAAGRRLELGGDLTLSATSSSDFSARGLGNTLDVTKLQDSAKVGIGVGVGLAITRNDTQAAIGAGSQIVRAGNIEVSATSAQNTSPGFAYKLAAEGVAGAGAEKVGIAGALAVANSESTTEASIGDEVRIGDIDGGTRVGNLRVSADNTSKLAAKAWSAALAGKVGVGASIAVLVSDNTYRAWIGREAEIAAMSLEVAGRNHAITGPAAFDWSLEGLKDRFTDANLQLLLGQNNYYTETIAGAGSNQVAVTGAFSVNVFEDTTEAGIDADARVSTTGAVDLIASNASTAKAFAGGISAAGKVGVGVASADIANEGVTRAALGAAARIEQSSSIAIDASSTMDLAVIAASAGAAGTAGVSGVLSLILSDNTVEATAGNGSWLRSNGDIRIEAANTFDALGVAGVAGIGGTAGVGVSAGTFLIDNVTQAWAGQDANLAAAGLITVAAGATQDVTSVVVGGAGGGTAGVAGSAAVNVYNPVTQAWIGKDARINAGLDGAALGTRALAVGASAHTELLSIVGTVGIGGTAGVGGAADVVVIDKETAAWLGEGVIARTGAALDITAVSTEKIRSIGVGVSAGGTAGVQGSASVLVLDVATLASAGAGSALHSEGNLVIAAESDSDLDLLAGAIGAAGTAAVGAGAAVAVVDKTTHAWIDDGASATALGKAAATQVASGNFGVSYAATSAGAGEVAAPGITPSNGKDSLAGGSAALGSTRSSASQLRDHRGLAVTAVNRDDIKGFAVTGAAAGTGAVTLSGEVSVHSTDTRASIGSIDVAAGTPRSGVSINADNSGADSAQSVLVAAGNDSFHLGIAGALAASGTVGVGVGADVAVMKHATHATITDHSTVKAARDVEVAANSVQEVVSVSASLGASGTVGVAGSVSVLSFDNQTWASIGDDAVVDAGGNVMVKADDDTATTLVAGTVALGIGGGGIGAGVGITLIDKDTRAWIGNRAVVDGRGQGSTALTAYSGDGVDLTTAMRGVQVQARSHENLFTVSAAGAGGLYLGFAGAASVATIDSDTLAYIGNGAQINTQAGAAHDDQDVNVSARNDLRLFNVSGALGVGAVGIAGAVDVGIIRNDTTAFIGDDATVKARRDIDVNALAKTDIDTYVVSAAGGLGALAGAVGVYSVGSGLDEDAQRRLQTDDGNAGSYVDGQATNGSISSVLNGYSDSRIRNASTRVATERADTAASASFTATETRLLPAGTAAFVGKRSTLEAGRNIDVDARQHVRFDMLNGGLAIGAIGLGAGVGVTSFRSHTTAFVDTGTTLNAGDAGTVSVSAALDEDLDSLAFAGTGGILAVDAAVAVLKSGAHVEARFEQGVIVEQAGSVRVDADDTRKLSAETAGASVGLIAAGASVTTAEITGRTQAKVGNEARVGQTAGRSVGRLEATADAHHEVSAKALAAKGGLGLAASGTVATATIETAVGASTGTDTRIKVSDDVLIDADAATAAHASATGINVSLGGAVGASIARARVLPQVDATVGSGSRIESASLSLMARQRLPGGIARSAYSSASGAAGGLLVGANASQSFASNTGQVRAGVGDDSLLTVTGIATVRTDNTSAQLAHVSGVSVGFVAIGANKATASSSTLSQATLGDRVGVSAGTLQVLANGNSTNHAHGVAGAGGLVSVPFSASYTSTVGTTIARIGSRYSASHPADARMLEVGTLRIDATQALSFDSWMRNLNASLIGVSGANAENFAFGRTLAEIGDNARVKGDRVELNAATTLTKGAPAGLLAGSGISRPAWNVESSSGGLADFPAAGSQTRLLADTRARVGASANITPRDPAALVAGVAIDAANHINASDRVTMTSGGAVSAASGESEIITVCPAGRIVCATGQTPLAAVEVANGAHIESAWNIALGSRTVASLSTQSAVDVYGLVGVAPEGSSVSSYIGSNRVTIGDATLKSGNDIKLSAGAATNGAGSSASARARTDVYNNTAIPVNRDPVADAFVNAGSHLSVAAGAEILSVRHTALHADRGSNTASGVGIGKDIYRETLAAIASWFSNLFGGDDVSFETRTGRSVVNQDSSVHVDGRVEVGINREQWLTIALDGSETHTDGISVLDRDFIGLATDILDRIAMLEELIRQYSVGNPSSDAAIAAEAYRSEVRFLERKLDEMGFPRDPSQPGFSSVPPESPLEVAQQSLSAMQDTRTELNAQVDRRSALNTELAEIPAEITALEAQITSLKTEIEGFETDLVGLDPDDTDDAAEITRLSGLITDREGQIAVREGLITTKETRRDVDIPAELGSIVAAYPNLDARLTDLNAQITDLDRDITAGEFSDVALAGPIARVLKISDSVAKLGNIDVRGNRLTGTGVLDAPGDASITITNYGPNVLILGNMTIAPNEGGKLFFNGVEVNANADIARINRGAGTAAFSSITTAETSGAGEPVILVKSLFSPLDISEAEKDAMRADGIRPLAPDIILRGDISNLRGLVKIDSAAGSIRLEQKRKPDGSLVTPVETATIRADRVEVKTRNGDFVQSYTDGAWHAAGEPLKVIAGVPTDPFPANVDSIERPATEPVGGIIANGSVLIAARYLNINGTIQSGIAEWGVRIPEGATVSLPGGGTGSFADARDDYALQVLEGRTSTGSEYYTVSGATVAGLGSAEWDAWESITVRYNAQHDRLELSGVQVQGGYIELFGQIFSTSQSGGGRLRVLDGYGRIKIDNETGKTLLVNTLDAGLGVKGRINITDIRGIDPATGAPILSEPVSRTRADGEARTGTQGYDPVSGLRYVVTTGYDEVRIDEYRYSQTGWFGTAILSGKALDGYRLRSIERTKDPLLTDAFLVVDPAADYHYLPGGPRTQEETVSSVLTPGRSWRECNWWSLCISARYYQEFSVTTGKKYTTTDSVRGDYRIGIEYIGFDEGRVDISSVGDVMFNGSVNNRGGNTTVSSAGSLTQNGPSAVLGGHSIDLSAGTGIGSLHADGTPDQALRIRQSEGGVVNAGTTSGSIYLEQTIGDLRVGTIGSAATDKVVLESAGDIVGRDASALVQARRIDLSSANGSIGRLDALGGDPLRIRSGYTTSEDAAVLARHGLSAQARGDINIANLADPLAAHIYTGDLLVVGVESLGGDVRITTTGSVIDNNPFATVDTRTEDELAALWDEMRLRQQPNDPITGAARGSDAKAQEAVEAYANGRSNNYRLYWQFRVRQADGGASYDPTFEYALTATEEQALRDTGMDAADIAAFADKRTQQYRALHEEVGSYTSTFDEDFDYRSRLSAEEITAITRGSEWTDAQLLLSVGAGLLKEITDTVTTIKAPNVVGRTVTLVAGDDIGRYGPDQVIDTIAGIDTLTKAQKAALAAVERGDAIVDDEDNPRFVTIRQPQPLNVANRDPDDPATLHATAAGKVFIGSEGSLRIGQVSAGDEVRIKVAGALHGIDSGASAVHINSGGRIILEAASGGIGGTLDGDKLFLTPLGIQLSDGAGLIARAGSDIWLAASSGLFVDTVFSIGDVRLDASGSILDFQLTENPLDPDLNILARNVSLNASGGEIGSADNPLDVALSDEDGRISASTEGFGNGVHLNGTLGKFFNIGAVRSGDAVALSSATFMFIDGRVSGPGPISLVAGAQMVLTPFADVHATTLGVFLKARDLLMQDAGDGIHAAQMRVDVGTIDLRTDGDAVITGIFTGNPTESAILITAGGSVYDGGDTRLDIIANTAPGATLTIRAGGQIGGNPLDIDVLNFNASAGGLIHIDSPGSLIMGDVHAEREIDIRAAGSISAQSVTSLSEDVKLAADDGDLRVGAISGRDVELSAMNGDADIGSIDAGSLDVDVPSGSVGIGELRATEVSIGARDRIDVDRLEVGRDLRLSADRIVAQVFASGSAPIFGAIGGYGGGMASAMDLTLSGLGGFHFDRIAALTGRIDIPVGTLQVDQFQVGDRVVVTNPQTRLLIDQHNFRLQGYDAQLYSGGPAFALKLDRNLIATDSFVIDRRASHEVLGPDGPQLSVVEYTERVLAEFHLAPPAAGAPREDEEESLVSVDANAVATDTETQ